MLPSNLKRAFFGISKYLGLFHLARYLTRRQLRILCYHGISLGNEASFRPTMFVDPQTFEQRLEYISKSRFPVMKLAEAVRRLRSGTLPPNAIAITIDDGFYGTYKHAVPLLKRFQMPATIYVTSYYVQKQNPIFRLAVQYIYWAARKHRFDLSVLGIRELQGEVVVGEDNESDPIMWKIIDYGETCCGESTRREIAERLARALEVDFRELADNRYVGLMTSEEIRNASADGMDIQLHTHRHRFPVDEASAKREIIDNRAVLEPLAGQALQHLCYPSGFWSERHWPWLAQLDIDTATTCEVGLNDPQTHLLALKRVFDASTVSALQFEAELSGYLELVRQLRSRLARVFHHRSAGQTEVRTA
jgi:peptidoglycan/xylan/chitin deacetylase (PgdA/CDA1 family)